MTSNSFLTFLGHGGAKLLIFGVLLLFNFIRRLNTQAKQNAKNLRTPPPVAQPMSASTPPVAASGTMNRPTAPAAAKPPVANPATRPAPTPRRSSRSKNDSPWSNSGGPFSS